MLNYHSRKRRGIKQLESIQGSLVIVVIVCLFVSTRARTHIGGTSKLSQLSQLSLQTGLDRLRAFFDTSSGGSRRHPPEVPRDCESSVLARAGWPCLGSARLAFIATDKGYYHSQ